MKTPTIVKRSSFKMVTLPDDSPDLSYLGEYSHTPKSAHSIDRFAEGRGGADRHTLRYFTPALTGEETGNPESPEQDFQRMEALCRGEWSMIGIRAEVTIQVPTKQGGSILQTLRSPGLWGIESDSDKAHLDEVFSDQCDILAEVIEEWEVVYVDDSKGGAE